MRALAVGLCIRPTDGALLVEAGYDRLTGARFYRAIGGAIEPDESAADAVVREWSEELGLTMDVGCLLGAIENRFIFEGRAGHEHVTVFEVVPADAGVFALPHIEARDPTGLLHVATWVAPAELLAGPMPLYPAGAIDLLRGAP